MYSFRAIIVMLLWSSVIGFSLYAIDAHIHFREIPWSISISIVLLLTHMGNMFLYFRIAGKEPYRWFKGGQ